MRKEGAENLALTRPTEPDKNCGKLQVWFKRDSST